MIGYSAVILLQAQLLGTAAQVGRKADLQQPWASVSTRQLSQSLSHAQLLPFAQATEPFNDLHVVEGQAASGELAAPQVQPSLMDRAHTKGRSQGQAAGGAGQHRGSA